jgi:hypothetical protein
LLDSRRIRFSPKSIQGELKMKKMKLTLTTLAASLVIMTFAAATQATVLRAFVSSTGNDANIGANCVQATPCRTFAVAIGAVTAGGELIALDTSGYGPLVINKAITIATVPGATAFVVAATTTIGFAVSAGATDMVKLRNINFNGSNAAGTTGLRHNSGLLIVENCTFQQLTIGVDCVAKMDLIDSDIHGCGTGIVATGQGTEDQGQGPTVSVVQVRVNRGNITFNTKGLQQTSPGFNGNFNPLHNIFVFSAGGPTLNMGGNTTAFACTDIVVNGGNTSCSPGPGTYSTTSGLK